MQISCAFPPAPGIVEHVQLAEELGYTRAWFYDSPALYPDVWVTIARVAERTQRIGLGTAVIIPNLRHPVTQAAAIASIEAIAPGRLAVALGTGFTGRMTMGQKPLTWKYMTRYIRQLQALLAGDAVEIEGGMCQLIWPEGFEPQPPIGTPIIVGANGPVGLKAARELEADGIMCVGVPRDRWDWCSILVFGTVLDDGEDPTSPRVVEAAGPGYVVAYHGLYERNPEAVSALPNGAAWREAAEQFPEDIRHLKVHEEHLVGINPRDRAALDPAAVASFGFTGTRDQLRERLARLEADGATEILYQPAGPDIPRELRAFADMAMRK